MLFETIHRSGRVAAIALAITFAARAAPPALSAPPATAGPTVGQSPVAETPDDTAPPPAKPDPAAAEFWRALKLLQSKQPADLDAGRKALQTVSDHEYIHAQVLLGDCHLSGSYGFSKDARKAVNLFRLAAERGNAYAKVSLGSCYATGTGVRKDDATAATWLTAALAPDADFSRPVPPPEYYQDENRAGGGVAGELATDPVSGAQATAHFLLGQINARANKPAEAQVHYQAAATSGPDGRSGIYQAAVEAALNFAFGKGTPRDPAKANEMLDQSRRLGARMGVSLIHNYVSLKVVDEFAVADLEEEVTQAGAGNQSAVQFRIAQTLADKKSKDYNAAEAARWYELAGENGQAWAMISLGVMYAHGELGASDPVKAFHWLEQAGSGNKPKNYLGAGDFAICLLQGLGTTKDPAKAAEIFRMHRNEDLVCYLGTIGQAPVLPIGQDEELALNQSWAKDRNDAHAQYLLGRRYLIGYGVKPSAEDAARWLKKAAKAHHGEALCLLGWLYQFYPALYGFSDPQKAARAATESYKAAGDAGSIEGLANYANSLTTGFGVTRDEDQAIAIYERCLKIDPDHSRSHSNLGSIYNAKLVHAVAAEVSFGTVELKAKMLEHYEASVRQDDAYAAIGLGDLYYEGRFVTADLAKAYSYYEKATTVPARKADAHFRLGYMHEFGQGVPITYTEAAYHYRLAALEGHIPALRRLVDFYVTGTGVSLDFDRAAYWLNFMIRLNQLDVLPTMADVLLKKQDYERAIQILNFLANSPNPAIAGYAHERLSRCYGEGKGVEKNAKRAEKYLDLAIKEENGDALTVAAQRLAKAGKNTEAVATFTRAARTSNLAAYNLGQMYYFGTLVPADLAAGIKYLRQAAASNNSDAQYFLAGLTWNRDPEAPAIDEAIAFARKAENLGLAKAAALREKLEQRRKSGADKPEENTNARPS